MRPVYSAITILRTAESDISFRLREMKKTQIVIPTVKCNL